MGLCLSLTSDLCQSGGGVSERPTPRPLAYLVTLIPRRARTQTLCNHLSHLPKAVRSSASETPRPMELAVAQNSAKSIVPFWPPGAARQHQSRYMIQPLVELYGSSMVVLKVS